MAILPPPPYGNKGNEEILISLIREFLWEQRDTSIEIFFVLWGVEIILNQIRLQCISRALMSYKYKSRVA